MNNKNDSKVSKRYADSLVKLMMDSEHSSNEIIENLENIRTILNGSKDLYNAMLNPVISASDKESVVESVFDKDCVDLVRNFLKILIEKNRFNLIFSIIEEAIKLINKINNITKVDITSAIKLKEERKTEIQNKLNEVLNKKIEIEYKTDNSIIAGLVFKIEDDVLDTSFKHGIEELKKELI